MTSSHDRQLLLTLAREALAAHVGAGAAHVPGEVEILDRAGGAFVTLHLRGELRGCIGHIEALIPLWESVRDMAAAAAGRDSRFPPVRPDEVPGLDFEISVLSPMSPVRVEDILVGTHGLYVKRDGVASGLLLPQVAVEWEWDAPEFLRRTFEKAIQS